MCVFMFAHVYVVCVRACVPESVCIGDRLLRYMCYISGLKEV